MIVISCGFLLYLSSALTAFIECCGQAQFLILVCILRYLHLLCDRLLRDFYMFRIPALLIQLTPYSGFKKVMSWHPPHSDSTSFNIFLRPVDWLTNSLVTKFRGSPSSLIKPKFCSIGEIIKFILSFFIGMGIFINDNPLGFLRN